MWSGPRNISTALMRSWENRPDSAVWDEPLYPHYLARTGRDHPGAAEVLATGETDWRKVVEAILGDVPGGKPIWYQKHMAHHLLPHVGRQWLDAVINCFLIRDPREMLTSYIRKIPDPTLDDLGLAQQVEIFRAVQDRTGRTPPVIDARDVLEHPQAMLEQLCAELDVPFDPRMLTWPAGPRASDGVWAKYWYHEVWQSTTFARYQPKPDEVPPHLQQLHATCQVYYDELYAQRLRPR